MHFLSSHFVRKQVLEPQSELVLHSGLAHPLMTIKKAAEQLVKTNATLYDARDVLEGTIRMSMGAVRAMLEATKSQDKYSVVSEDIQHVMIEETKKLEKQLMSVGIEDKSIRRKALTDKSSRAEKTMTLEEGLFSDGTHGPAKETDEKIESGEQS